MSERMRRRYLPAGGLARVNGERHVRFIGEVEQLNGWRASIAVLVEPGRDPLVSMWVSNPQGITRTRIYISRETWPLVLEAIRQCETLAPAKLGDAPSPEHDESLGRGGPAA